ncbi:MAG: GyrI-like domain-containing protein [Chloroflexi bacterium]|nr:GyrI-like domain-containing protein [Chloroflexota bacterium]
MVSVGCSTCSRPTTSGPSLAKFYDDPAKVAKKNLRCDLCAPVGPHVTGSGDIQTKEIGGWQVATVVYQGEENVRRAYDEVYDWLHAQGYHEADAPVEKYLSALGEELRAEIAVPVIKKELMPGRQKIKRAPAKKTTRKTRAKTASAKKT